MCPWNTCVHALTDLMTKFACNSPFPHDIAIKGVQDALVSQLQRVIQDFPVLAAGGYQIQSSVRDKGHVEYMMDMVHM